MEDLAKEGPLAAGEASREQAVLGLSLLGKEVLNGTLFVCGESARFRCAARHV